MSQLSREATRAQEANNRSAQTGALRSARSLACLSGGGGEPAERRAKLASPSEHIKLLVRASGQSLEKSLANKRANSETAASAGELRRRGRRMAAVIRFASD